MKIVIAPDSFKGSLSAAEVADALERGIRKVWPSVRVEKVPMADGGEGTAQALVDATQGDIVHVQVTGPLGDPIEAFFGLLGSGRTAVIEMAAASGLPLVPPDRRDPRQTTTRGTGELIRHALDRGCDRIIVGIGGSATNDGGIGMAQALGASFCDEQGREIPGVGGALNQLAVIDLSALDPRLSDVDILVACDVDNPLCGPRGASAVYGPQKGATPDIVAELDQGLSRLAELIEAQTGLDVKEMPGAGAAGGLGAGLVAFLGATLKPGIDIVLDAVGFNERLVAADLVITGEGAIDSQTAYGKTPSGVAKAAGAAGIPVVAVAGSVADDARLLYDKGFSAILSCTPRPMSLAEAVPRTSAALSETGEVVARLIQLGVGLSDPAGNHSNA